MKTEQMGRPRTESDRNVMINEKLEMNRIFSGDNSRLMWKEINSIKNEKVQDALYSIACKCQELEAVIREFKREGG